MLLSKPMKIQFKKQAFQTAAVNAIADCFAGQPQDSGVTYRVDPGRREASPQARAAAVDEFEGFRNADIALPEATLLGNVQAVQQRENLNVSDALVADKVSPVNLDVEMETGTGKTYCYIKTMFELNRRFGWRKFIVVVPSIAIREGVYESFRMTADHFLADYGQRARFFIYDSKQLHNLESYSADAGINVMIINVQAFNARGKDARRIYEELDDFQSRRPIDVIKANRPILILDEPQKMGGRNTQESFQEFTPLMMLRYSATHKVQHNKVYRLDAVDAYQQKLVKKIGVRGISVKGLKGTDGYLYLESIEVSASKKPEARIELETRKQSGIKREVRRIRHKDNLHELSGGLDQYQGYVVADIDAISDTISFTNGEVLQAGQASGDVNETTLRQIQIREAIRAHFEKEQLLFYQGVKVLTLFFIDEVAKYRFYDDTGEQPGEYARMFEEEYERQREEAIGLFRDTPYAQYLQGIDTARTHNGYFSIDKKKRLVDPKVKKRGEQAGHADDVDAYDLILKDKQRLLSLDEPTRFIFSHSALREGWDNPNVFVIGTLKHSDSTISRRQEVGRGMRLAVNKLGERLDDPATVHRDNVLTVVANESYQDFVSGLQKDISESLSERPRVADEDYFNGKVLNKPDGEDPVTVTPQMAKQIYRYLLKNDYTDDDDHITQNYHTARREGERAELPDELKPHAQQVFQLIDSVFSDADLPGIDNDRATKTNPLNANFDKKEFQALWKQINQKAAYTVEFDTTELVSKCVTTLDNKLRVSPLQYEVQRGEQKDDAGYEAIRAGQAFEVRDKDREKHKSSVHSGVAYDLIGRITEQTQLTRRTVGQILGQIQKPTFDQYATNPEDFIIKATRLINEQKATVIVEHLTYDPIDDHHGIDIFTHEKPKASFDKAVKADRHIYDYVFTDSKNERDFVGDLDTSNEVVVYAKLPSGFFIPTPVGDYNPDWAIAFTEGKVKHIYFIAETKGSMSSLELREIEESKIKCARKFFESIEPADVRYDVVNSYDKLMDLVA